MTTGHAAPHVPQPRLLLDARAEVGEGPVWDDRRGCLWWVDIPPGLIHETDPETGRDRTISLGQPVGAVALHEDGDLIICARDGVVRLDPATGRRESLATLPARRGIRMNDAKVGPDGRLWCETMESGGASGLGALHRLDPDGRLTTVLDGLSIPNGIGWSSDGGTMYLAESSTGRVDAFAYDLATGRLGMPETFCLLTPEEGTPDGLTVDAEGGVWVALWDGWAVRRYTPDARLVADHRLPVAQVTCPTFGGQDLRTLYITTAHEGFAAGAMAGQQQAGGLYALDVRGVRGLPAARFGQ